MVKCISIRVLDMKNIYVDILYIITGSFFYVMKVIIMQS